MKEENIEEEILIKCKVRLSRQTFPKDKIIGNGDFGIISATVLDVLQGEPLVNKWGCITLTGSMCEINDEDIYVVIGKEKEHEKFGIQYEVVFMCIDIKLTNKDDQYKFLEKILPERQCVEIFKAFENPVDILENKDIKALCTIKGIGVPTAIKIIDKYESSKDYSEAYVRLDKYGLSKNIINKLVDFYGSPNTVIAKVEGNPYILIDEVEGIGWIKADEMALNSGLGEYSINRVKAYIKYYLYEEANTGNTWVDIDDLLSAIDGTLGCELPQDVLIEALQELNKTNEIWTNEERDKIALQKFYTLEKNIAEELKRINSSANTFVFDNWEEKISEQEKRQGWEFTEEQKEGIKAILENQIVIIIGLGGTGKSSTVSGMLEVFKQDYSFAQTALSGRASCNLSEITGVEGYTIHRLLGYIPEKGFAYNKNNPLPTNIIILDELSMVGADIFYKLIQAIQTGSKLIMLGDMGQLEAIGIGNVMKDMIDSEYIKCVELTKIHRQAAKSAIITESKKIRFEEQIIDKDFTGAEIRGELEDLELDIYTDKNKTHDKIIKHFEELLLETENSFDIQVVVPMKDRGKASAYYLNNSLQEIVINKSQKGLSIGEESDYPFTIYIGDKVVNHKNNYKTLNEYGDEVPIFNGDLGIVVDIDFVSRIIIVDFNNKGRIYIPKKHLAHIRLGYAITCHKLQGSGMKYVICGLDYSHYKLLNKEMVYTMLTRAKKYCVLCAENKALRYATTRSGVKTKQTFLKYFLSEDLQNDTQENF
ncbi:MAG: AAA family ATPase [Tissierellia bacterium]|nr:AAA family ATPase [Tissierellia bacterium]